MAFTWSRWRKHCCDLRELSELKRFEKLACARALYAATLYDYMREVTSNNFGILIAYLVPGFTALWGVSYFSQTVSIWLTGTTTDGPTVGGFLYVTLAAVAAGMTVSTVRWALIDSLHHATGIERPEWNFAKLQQQFDAYDRLESNHYRYYQFYSGMVIALVFTWISRHINDGASQIPVSFDMAFASLAIVFFAGSRDTLTKYYIRVSNLLGADTNAQENPQRDSGTAQPNVIPQIDRPA